MLIGKITDGMRCEGSDYIIKRVAIKPYLLVRDVRFKLKSY